VASIAAISPSTTNLTPCPLCQQNVEIYEKAVNKQFGTDFNIPIVFYSQLMALAFGMDAKADAALDRQMIPSAKLEAMAKK
jgi:heterodisulfide reductase subunit B2